MPVPEQTPDYRDLANWVVLRLLDAVKTGAIKSGERLVERDIAARFGVSRAPVRDALHKLESLGVIERRSPRGVYVRSWSESDAAEIVLLTDGLIYLSVQLAAERISDEDLAELQRIVDATAEMVESGSTDAAAHLKLDLGFHIVIARASGNKRLVALLERLILPLEIYPDPFKVRIDPQFSLRQHRALLATLRAHDREAAVQCVLRNFIEGLHATQQMRAVAGLGASASPAPAPAEIEKTAVRA